MLRTPHLDVSWRVITARRLIVEIVPGRILRVVGGVLAVVGGIVLLQSVVQLVADVPSLIPVEGAAPARSARWADIVLGGIIGNVGAYMATYRHRIIVDRDQQTVDDTYFFASVPRRKVHPIEKFERVLVGWHQSQQSATDDAAARYLDVTLRSPRHTLLVVTISTGRARQAHDLGLAVAEASGLRFESVVEVDRRA